MKKNKQLDDLILRVVVAALIIPLVLIFILFSFTNASGLLGVPMQGPINASFFAFRVAPLILLVTIGTIFWLLKQYLDVDKNLKHQNKAKIYTLVATLWLAIFIVLPYYLV